MLVKARGMWVCYFFRGRRLDEPHRHAHLAAAPHVENLGSAHLANHGGDRVTGIWPPLAREFRVSQHFGENPAYYAPYGLAGHHGVDIPGDVGEPLHAGVSGWLYTTQTYREGIRVHMQSPQGTLLYGHCQAVVGPSRNVHKGDVVALLGNTGANTTGAHVHVTWTPMPTDWNNGYKGMVDPWPMIQEGMMELEQVGELATALRWELEEAQREDERAADLDALAERLRQSARMRRERLISRVDGLAYAVEVAAGRDAPKEWKGQS